MAKITDFISQNATPIGMAAQGVGGLLNVVGAFGQKKEAKRQVAKQAQFATQQRGFVNDSFNKLISQAEGLPTYQADVSGYDQMVNLAQEQARQARGRVAGMDIASENISQQGANVMGAIQRAGRSSTDILSSILFGQNQLGGQQRILEQAGLQSQQQMGLQANQNLLSATGQRAAAIAQQKALQFESQAQKANTLLGLQQQKLGSQIDLEQQLFNDQMAKAGALADARASIWSGFGGVLGAAGQGMVSNALEQQKILNYKNSKTA